MEYKIILASKSPRRKELLNLMGVNFEIMVSDKEEVLTKKTSIKNTPKQLALHKAQDILTKTEGDRVIISSDTIVARNNTIYGKPCKEKSAKKILNEISGKTHFVYTGLCVLVVKNNLITTYLKTVKTKVKMTKLDDIDIEKYIATGEPFDKAGAYGLQGIGGMFIEKIYGNVASVIGLPTFELFKIFKKENII